MRREYAVAGACIAFLLIAGLLLKQEDSSSDSVVPAASPHSLNEIKILLGGDLMFDRTVRQVAEKKGYSYLLQDLEPLLKEHDFVIANLEGPITSEESLSIDAKVGDTNNTRFTFDPLVAETLASFGITVHIGNNHISDFGEGGIMSTTAYLKKQEVVYFGDAHNDVPFYTFLEKDGTRIAVVSYNAFRSNSFARAKNMLYVLEGVADISILYAHWGEEYVLTGTTQQREQAHAFAEAGADLIVGSHSHVVQNHEMYGTVPIYYSLGNLIFDQYFSPNVRCGALLSVTIEDRALKQLQVIPVYLESTRQTTQRNCPST